MPAYKIISRPGAAPGPSCELCETDMWLRSIEPDKPGYDRRTFECPMCQHLIVKIIKYSDETIST